MKQSPTLPTEAIRRVLKNHGRLCTRFIYSDPDRMNKCSCGRDAALLELEAIERALGMEYDRRAESSHDICHAKAASGARKKV